VQLNAQNHGVRRKNYFGNTMTGQSYGAEENIENVDELEKQLKTSRTEVLDYQQKVLQHQQELEYLETMNTGLRTELCIARNEIRKLKVGNININEELKRFKTLDIQKETKIREFQNHSNRLRYQITVAQSEANEALANNGKLESKMMFLEKRVNDFYSNITRTVILIRRRELHVVKFLPKGMGAKTLHRGTKLMS